MAKYCTQCNLKYSNSAEKCVSCGAELAVRESDVKKKKIVIIALISVLLIAAIVVGIVISSITLFLNASAAIVFNPSFNFTVQGESR